MSSSRAEEIQAEEYYDLILEVKHNRKTLSRAIIGLEKDGQYFLPMLELANLFDFAASYDEAASSVSGFFLKETNTYALNLDEKTFSLKGNSTSFNDGEAFFLQQKYGQQEVYLSPELLNKIWPISLEFNNLLQVITVETKKRLPYEVRNKRERERKKKLSRLDVKNALEAQTEEPSLIIKNKPRLFSLPALNVNTTVQWQGRDSSHRETIAINGRNDLLYGEVDYNIRAQNDTKEDSGLQDIRFRYTKQAYEDGDLPLNVELLQLGDVTTKTARLAQGGLRGRGVVLTNKKQTNKVSFDSLTVEGIAEPGWEVELYRNNQLIGFQIVSDTGEYSFEDVQLNYSRTVIKTILYGPQGQIEEKEEVYNISRDMLRPGETNYEFSVLDADRDLILVNDEELTREAGFAKNLILERGINSKVSAFGSLTDLPTETGQQRFATLGLKFSLFDTIGAVEAYRALDGGHALDFNFSRKLFGTNVNLRTSFLDDFESNIVGYGDNADVFRLRANASRSLKLPVGNLGLQLGYDYERRDDQSSLTTFTTGQNFSFKKFRFSNTTTSRLNEERHINSGGKLNFYYNHSLDWRFRGVVDYDVYPVGEIDSLRAELRYKSQDGLTAAADVDYNIRSKNTKLGTQIGYDFDTFRSSLDLDWDSENGARAMLRTRFSMAPYGFNSKYIFDSKSLVNRSGVAGRIFYDNNYDGVFNEGDEPAQNVLFKAGKTKSGTTNDEGIAQYKAQRKQDYETISLDLSAVENPYVISTNDEFKTILRAGTAQKFDFPIIQTGIIEGFIYDQEGPIASIGVQLLNNNREIVETVKTAFDGFYSFEYIRPGDYIVQVDPAITQVNIPPRSVSVTSEDLFQFGIDLQTLEQAAEAACDEVDPYGRVTQNCQKSASLMTGMGQSALVPNGENTSGVQAFQTGEGTSGAQTIPPYKGTSGVRVSQVRVGEYSDKLRLVLDLSAPTAIRTWEQSDRKQVTIEIQDVDWQAMREWVNKRPHIVKDYTVEPLGAHGVRITLNASKKIRIKEKRMLTPNGKDFFRFYIDFSRCEKGCY